MALLLFYHTMNLFCIFFYPLRETLNLFNGHLGVSLKTQELYALVFLARYLDLFTQFYSVYNTVMKLVFIATSLAIVWCMRIHPVVKRSYDKELDTFRHYILIVGSLVLALIFHEKFTVQEVNSSNFTWFLCIFPYYFCHFVF